MILDVASVNREQPYEKDDKAPLIGPSSYKEHGFRMLMIWASGLNPEISIGKELCDALFAVDKKSVAGKRFITKLLIYLFCNEKKKTIVKIIIESVRKHMDQEKDGKEKMNKQRCHKCSIT